MVNYRRGASKISGFALSALLSGAANVLTIPFVVDAVGPTAWAAVATGQAAGAVGSVLVQMGWGVSGPTKVAAAKSPSEGLEIYRESLYYRLIILIPVLIIVSIATWFVVPPEFAVASIVTAGGSTLYGLSASWFLVGRGEPLKLLFLDTVPRSAVIVVGALVVTQVQGALVFALFIVASSIIPFCVCTYSILFGSRVRSRRPSNSRHRRPFHEVLVEQWPGVTTSLIASSYKYLPLLVISGLTPSYAPAYALVDRILKFAISGIRPVSQALQGWVPNGPAAAVPRRISLATRAAFAVGTIAGLGFIAVGPFLSGIVGGGEITLGWSLIIPAAVALTFGTISQTTGLACLMARGQGKMVAVSALVGAAICLIVIWPAVLSMAAVGAIWSVAVAEAGVLLIQTVALRRRG